MTKPDCHDLIIVPGGGVRPKGELPPWTQRRLERAIERAQTAYILVLSAGTTYKPPPLNENGFPIFEATAAADYLVRRGVSAHKLFIEACSYDTIGNAYFSRLLHVEPGGFQRPLVITSEFHMPRTRRIFDWVYALDAEPGRFSISYETVSDEGIDAQILQARREKEQQSLAQLENVISSIASLRALQRWLFTQHQAYCAAAAPSSLNRAVLASY